MAEKTMGELAAELAALKDVVEAMNQEISILKLAVAAGGQLFSRRNLPPTEKTRLKAEFLAKVKGK